MSTVLTKKHALFWIHLKTANFLNEEIKTQILNNLGKRMGGQILKCDF